jgi:protease-4
MTKLKFLSSHVQKRCAGDCAPYLTAVLALLLLMGAGKVSGAESKAKGARPGARENKDAADQTKPAVRIISLKGNYEDHPTAPSPFSVLSGDLEKPGSFFALCDKIDDLAEDNDIQHVLFDLSATDFRMNLAQLSELARHVQKLRAAGKKTFAWLETGETAHYSAACACDTILMADVGVLDLPSLSMSTLHFRDAMDLLGAKANVARVGDFKGAVEPFTLSEMSEALRTHYKEMLTSMNDAVVDRIAAARKLDRARVRQLQAERLFTAGAAEKAHLVDQLAPYGSVRETVAKLLGTEPSWITAPKAQMKQLSFFDLMSKLLGGPEKSDSDEPSVAVLHLDGMIVDGESERHGMIVAGPMVKVIAELQSDKNVRAVVVRINSPGGSATASEAIRRALEKLAAKKPVAISMGELAASGGYWIACLGRPIYAEPGTITGSIGVFALKLSFAALLKKTGLKVENVTLDESATAMSIERTWSPAEQEKMQQFVEDLYDKFLDRVCASRKMKREAVSAIAGGRVWSGAQAKKLGLIDRLGGLDDALTAMTKEAGVDPDAPVIHRPQQKSPFENLDLFGEGQDDVRLLLSAGARAYLKNMGLRFSVPLALAGEAMAGNAARAWLLQPTEILVR